MLYHNLFNCTFLHLTSVYINPPSPVCSQVYRGAQVTAVDHLCLGIPRGECFGLLGINGKLSDVNTQFNLTVFRCRCCCCCFWFLFPWWCNISIVIRLGDRKVLLQCHLALLPWSPNKQEALLSTKIARCDWLIVNFKSVFFGWAKVRHVHLH